MEQRRWHPSSTPLAFVAEGGTLTASNADNVGKPLAEVVETDGPSEEGTTRRPWRTTI